ncbi:MAG: polysaccharide deacetylase family protein [Candidatus Zixiibacteriota bacterium]
MTNADLKQAFIFTVDVEDWGNSTLGSTWPITGRFLAGLYSILELLEDAGGKGTFFILGAAAGKYPEAVRAVAAAGHDVAAHGYEHAAVNALDPERFREDLRRVGGTLADITGARPVYYRAPDFSIDAASLWALDALAEEGFVADSSIFPIRGRRYGIPWWPPEAREVLLPGGRSLVELPLPTLQSPGVKIPAVGGGYTRVTPYSVLRAVLKRRARAGRPGVYYCHPYELDAEEIAAYRDHMPLRTRLSQGTGRRGMHSKLRRLFRDFRTLAVSEFLGSAELETYAPSGR